jgi:hypothetical protein
VIQCFASGISLLFCHLFCKTKAKKVAKKDCVGSLITTG